MSQRSRAVYDALRRRLRFAIAASANASKPTNPLLELRPEVLQPPSSPLSAWLFGFVPPVPAPPLEVPPLDEPPFADPPVAPVPP
jgi:hypothetical protein